MSNYFHGGSPHKGKFLKSNRVTFSLEIVNRAKKVVEPSVGAYDPKHQDKIIGLIKSKV